MGALSWFGMELENSNHSKTRLGGKKSLRETAKKFALEFRVLSEGPFYINTHSAHPYSTP